MKLTDCDITKLLPQFMKKCTSVLGLSDAVSGVIVQIAQKLGTLSAWANINNLESAELAELAWELQPFWYKYAQTPEQKADVLKQAFMFYKEIGTVKTLQGALDILTPGITVLEWMDYGGTPYTFRLDVTGAVEEYSPEFEDRILRIVDELKRASQVLERLILARENAQGENIYTGFATQINVFIENEKEW